MDTTNTILLIVVIIEAILLVILKTKLQKILRNEEKGGRDAFDFEMNLRERPDINRFAKDAVEEHESKKDNDGKN